MSFDINITLKRGGLDFTYHFQTGPGLTALFGPSGAGKTSALDAIAGLIQPQTGHVTVSGKTLFNRPITPSSPQINLKPEHRRCGYVFQDLRLFPHMTVKANLRYSWGHHSGNPMHLAWDHMLDLLGIAGLLDRMPATLSGGEAQRVAIGRALFSNPAFLLMDEPLASVDMERREGILCMIERIRDEMRLPILYISHDRAEVERLSNHIIAIERPSAITRR